MIKPTLLSTAIIAAAGLYAASAPLAIANPGEDTYQSSQQGADAGTQGGQSDIQFTQLDQDGDGYLSENEVQASADLTAEHSELDTDQDGKVSRTEFAAFEGAEYGSSTSGSPSSEMPEREGATSEQSSDWP